MRESFVAYAAGEPGIHDTPEDWCKPNIRSSYEHHCSFGGAEASAEGSQLHSDRADLGKEGRSTHAGRQPQRVLPWWRLNANGSYVFFIRSGSKPIEFEKGKNAIAVPSLDKVPLIIDILITAVRNGELDEQLAQTKKPPTVLKYLKTA